MKTTVDILRDAKLAEREMRGISSEKIDEALKLMAEELILAEAKILEANALDCEAAKDKIGAVMIDRLCLDSKRIRSMADGILDAMALPSPMILFVALPNVISGLLFLPTALRMVPSPSPRRITPLLSRTILFAILYCPALRSTVPPSGQLSLAICMIAVASIPGLGASTVFTTG